MRAHHFVGCGSIVTVALVAASAVPAAAAGRTTAAPTATAATAASAAPPATAARSSAAASGTLDPGFGQGGRVSTDLGGLSTVYATVVQADGRIVAVGYVSRNGDEDFALARYTRDGTLDPAFGTGGIVRTDISGTGSDDVARAVALQADGRIVVAGQSTAGAGITLARYDRDGSLDPAFGSAGVVTTGITGIGYAVATGPDGRILVAGSADAGTGNDVVVVRLRPDGSPDPAFGTGGTVLTDVGGAGSNDVGDALALQPDGAVLVAGSSDSGTGSHALLLRYRGNGTLDPTFGRDGVVVTSPASAGNASRAAAVTLGSGGTVVTAGSTRLPGGGSGFAVARYRRDGSPDTSFGSGGVAVTQVGGPGSYAYGSAVAVDHCGRIVVAGSAGNQRSGDFAVARYTRNGVLDADFGSAGSVVTDVSGGDDRAFAVALRPRGRILVAGYAGGPFFAEFTLTRYLA